MRLSARLLGPFGPLGAVALAGAVAAFLGGGCSSTSNGTGSDLVAQLSESDFRCAIEPILIRDCSYLACHGNAGMALRVYSIGKLRAGDAPTLDTRTAPLTSDEEHANFQSAVGFSFPNVPPDQNFLVRKPLPAAHGGYEHTGGAIYTGVDDPRLVNMLSWLEGQPLTCPGRLVGLRPTRGLAPLIESGRRRP